MRVKGKGLGLMLLPNRTLWENVDKASNNSSDGSIFQGFTAALYQTKAQR